MQSSEPLEQPVSANPVASYAFEQLDPPPPGSAEDIADVLSAVRAEADRIRAGAWAAGEADGRAAGLAAARADAQPALSALAAAVQSVEQLRAQVAVEAEQDAVEMAVRLAEQIVAGVISIEPERVLDVARNALRHLIDRRHVTLIVNPADLELVGESVENLSSGLGGIEHLSVQADRRIGRGGAIARTEAGEIDSGISTQLGRAREIAAAAISPERADAA
jgi:flagellar biosynthesis/type III secretory pathway protein FliH